MMAIHNSAGRGRKYCKACGKYVGVRSRVCPNCSAVFSSNLRAPEPIKVRSEVTEVVSGDVEVVSGDVEVVSKPEEKVSSKGSRIDRIDYLKKELIRELKISSRAYGQGILAEIIFALRE